MFGKFFRAVAAIVATATLLVGVTPAFALVQGPVQNNSASQGPLVPTGGVSFGVLAPDGQYATEIRSGVVYTITASLFGCPNTTPRCWGRMTETGLVALTGADQSDWEQFVPTPSGAVYTQSVVIFPQDHYALAVGSWRQGLTLTLALYQLDGQLVDSVQFSLPAAADRHTFLPAMWR